MLVRLDLFMEFADEQSGGQPNPGQVEGAGHHNIHLI